VFAESDKKAKRIGIVYSGDYGPQSAPNLWSPFNSELRERGWVEGRNLIVERREYARDQARLPELMTELIALDVDLIFVTNAPQALAAKAATDRIPIVFTVGDSVGRGLVANLSRPERNLTGTSGQFVEVQAKRVELLQRVVPGIKRVAALQNTTLGYPPEMFQDRNKPRGVEVLIVPLKSIDDFERAMREVSERRADAILVGQVWPGMFQARVVEAVAKPRLPAIFPARTFVELGALFSFGPAWDVVMRLNAAYVDKILRGAKPADLPVEQPMVFDLAINLNTARALGITVPRELLVRADLVVE